MIIQQDETSASYQIKRYERGRIWINQDCYEQSVILTPHQLLVPWAPRAFNELQLEHFAFILENPPQILLLGTGQDLIIPPDKMLSFFLEKNIGIEFMDSKAACYTFTVLAAEERDVAACILIV